MLSVSSSWCAEAVADGMGAFAEGWRGWDEEIYSMLESSTSKMWKWSLHWCMWEWSKTLHCPSADVVFTYIQLLLLWCNTVDVKWICRTPYAGTQPHLIMEAWYLGKSELWFYGQGVQKKNTWFILKQIRKHSLLDNNSTTREQKPDGSKSNFQNGLFVG